MRSKQKRRSDCPISFALDIFGDKWSLLVIRDLMFHGKKTYGEFLASEEKISTNILADRLAALECAGLIESKGDSENKTRKLYSLTDKGTDLVHVIFEIVLWSSRYDEKTGAPPEFVSRLKHDKETFAREVIASHRKPKTQKRRRKGE